MTLPRLRLRKRDQQRLRDGHLWVYSNEIDTDVTPLKSISGSLVLLEDYRGHFLATASFNAHALICARVLSAHPVTVLDTGFFQDRLTAALRLRTAAFELPYYRLVYGEADQLPGVIIDRFKDTVVVQLSTQAMEDARAALVAALRSVLGDSLQIVFKNDGKGRRIEGLTDYVETLVAPGQMANPVLEVIENGVSFETSVDGQKTGWFYDHRAGRHWLNHWVRQSAAQGQPLSVLDLFSYIGGWGVQAAAHGAALVTCLDASAQACEQVNATAARLGLAQVSAIQADIFHWLKQPVTQQYDVVVLDPPALIQKRKDLREGRQAYFTLNEAAIQRVKPGGLLISASCSSHLERSELILILNQIARRQKKQLQLVHEAHPAADQPRLLTLPETDYLKCLFLRVSAVQ